MSMAVATPSFHLGWALAVQPSVATYAGLTRSNDLAQEFNAGILTMLIGELDLLFALLGVVNDRLRERSPNQVP